MHRMLQSFLGAVPQSVFSPFLAELYASTDPDKQQLLLIQACSSEPYLCSKLVNMANSVYYGRPGHWYLKVEDCLARIGLEEAMRLAMRFFVEAGMKDLFCNEERSQAVWQEAVFAAQLAQLISGFGGKDVQDGKPFLSTLLSYLGELYLVGPVFDKLTGPIQLGFYSQGNEGEIDPFELTKALMKKLGLPEPVTATILSVEELHYGGMVDEQNSAAVVTLARGLAQTYYPEGVFVARMKEPAVTSAINLLQFEDVELTTITERAEYIREQLPVYLA